MKTPAQLREMAADKRKRADRLTAQANRASANAPGSYVTGGSGRSRAQNRATERALDLTIDNAVKANKLYRAAAALEQQADQIEDVAGQMRRELAKQCVAEAERKERAAIAALPIANDPAAPLHVTKAEWAKTHRDYKGIEPRDGFRRRSMVRDGSLQEVFLTDAKVVT